MKKIFSLLTVAVTLISACLIYLIHAHIGVRPQTLIKPSLLTDNVEVARAVFIRLAPEFQTANYVVVADKSESSDIFAILQRTYEKGYGHSVTVLAHAENADDEKLRSCEKPCWLMVDAALASELDGKSDFFARLERIGLPYFTLTSVGFSKIDDVPKNCVEQKRLSFECLVPVAVHEAQRKMREPNKRYFFLKKYLEKDFFLFIQKRSNIHDLPAPSQLGSETGSQNR